MTESLQQAVFGLTTALLWPVVTALLFAVAHAAFLLASLLVEAAGRRGPAEHLRDPGRPPQAMTRRRGVAEWLRQQALDPGASGWLLLDRAEAALARRVDRARLWVRLAPALGLAGTLIPLGPALLALAQNDLSTLAERLILAFGTTVLGLLAGGAAWVAATTLERWYRLDLAEVRHGLELVEGGPA